MTSKVISIWAGMPSVVRTSLVAIFGSLATILAFKAEEIVRPKASNEVYWNESDIRKIFREEMTPLKVGFLESIKGRSAVEQLRIVSAMRIEEDKLRDKK
jgi:hypothetical protein